jgi:acetylornithine deacetylase/succinyl-diaminopimelate desuccinylase-like protein
MIFVPSRGGRSHCPEEYTSPDQMLVGVRVLAETLRRLAYLGRTVAR